MRYLLGVMILLLAASSALGTPRETASSKASGPSTTPPVICPRCAMTVSAAASSEERNLGMTISVEERIATRGRAMPSARARSIAFCTMSRLTSSVGAMVSAPSVSSRGRG